MLLRTDLSRVFHGLFVTVFLLGSLTLSAQTQSPTELTKPKVIASDFSALRAARELSDGRVIVSGTKERALYLINPESQNRKQLGRIGDGPDEYQVPTQLIAFGKDSTLVVDGGARRRLLLRGAGFAELADQLKARARTVAGEMEGVDRVGNVLMLRGTDVLKKGERFRYTGAPLASKSVAVILARRNGKADTLGLIGGGWEGKRQIRVKSGEIIEYISPFPTYEQVAMFPDGRIAVARQFPYRVDWLAPNGSWTRGVPIVDQPVAVTANIRQQIASEHPRVGTKPDDYPVWPKTVPPFLREAVFAGSDGALYIRRTPLSKKDRLVDDVFTEAGGRTTFVLPPDCRLLGVGERGLYAAMRDDNDLESLVFFERRGGRQ